MRKQLIDAAGIENSAEESTWIDLERCARVELTSEDPDHPIDSAFQVAATRGWRAAAPGAQTIRICFDVPVRIRRIQLVFREHAAARTHEFSLRWSDTAGATREILRQQFTFSPPGTTSEMEDYAVELDGVASLELDIVPDVHGSGARASLSRWLLA